MSDHEDIIEANSPGEANERLPIVPAAPAEAQPLIMYDLATIIGAVYQHRITLTKL